MLKKIDCSADGLLDRRVNNMAGYLYRTGFDRGTVFLRRVNGGISRKSSLGGKLGLPTWFCSIRETARYAASKAAPVPHISHAAEHLAEISENFLFAFPTFSEQRANCIGLPHCGQLRIGRRVPYTALHPQAFVESRLSWLCGYCPSGNFSGGHALQSAQTGGVSRD